MSHDNNNSYNYCNGKASVNKGSSNTGEKSDFASPNPKTIPIPFTVVATKSLGQNLNWLLYWMYSRGDYENCKILIQKQLRDNYEEEYLFYIQVRAFGLKGEISVTVFLLTYKNRA